MINGPKDYTIRIYINPRKKWEGIKKALHQIRCLMQGSMFLLGLQSLLASFAAAVIKVVTISLRSIEHTVRCVLLPLDALTAGGRCLRIKRRLSHSWQSDDVSFHRITTAQDDRADT